MNINHLINQQIFLLELNLVGNPMSNNKCDSLEIPSLFPELTGTTPPP